MLRAKAVRDQKGEALRSAIACCPRPTVVGRHRGIPVVREIVNAVERAARVGRALLEGALGVHRDAPLPGIPLRRSGARGAPGEACARGRARARATTGRVAVFATCYGNRNEPQIVDDLLSPCSSTTAFPSALAASERCCGMPKLELGDLEARREAEGDEHPGARRDASPTATTSSPPVPSCVLMFKQELPLLFPDDPTCGAVARAHIRPVRVPDAAARRGQAAQPTSSSALGKVAYHVPCHLRVQNDRPEDARAAVARAGHADHDDRALLGPRRHLRRQARVPRGLDEDRKAGGAARRGGRAGRHSRAIARWRRPQIASGIPGASRGRIRSACWPGPTGSRSMTARSRQGSA